MTVGLAVMVFTGLRVGLAVMVFTGLRGRRDLIMADLTGLEAVLAGCWGLGCCFELGGLVGVMLDLTCCCCFSWFGEAEGFGMEILGQEAWNTIWTSSEAERQIFGL